MLAETDKRRRRALTLHEQGKTSKEIAATIGVTRQRAEQLVAEAISKRGNA
jgi:DNA-directed RNA polymerase sigma subunit (sigma70/sigma32)